MEVPAEHIDQIGYERSGVPSDLYESSRERLVVSIKRGAVILIAAALVTTSLGLLRYSPLSGSMPASVAGSTVTDGSTRYVATFTPAGTFEYSFAVRNDGRWGVTISGLRAPVHGAFEEVEILVTTPGSSEPRALETFALGAGESAVYNVRVTFGDCETPLPAGGRTAWNREVVGYRVLGVAREMAVDLPYRLVVDTADAPNC